MTIQVTHGILSLAKPQSGTDMVLSTAQAADDDCLLCACMRSSDRFRFIQLHFMCTNLLMFLQVQQARLLGSAPTNWLRFMLQTEYVLVDEFRGDHAAVVQQFKE